MDPDLKPLGRSWRRKDFNMDFVNEDFIRGVQVVVCPLHAYLAL